MGVMFTMRRFVVSTGILVALVAATLFPTALPAEPDSAASGTAIASSRADPLGLFRAVITCDWPLVGGRLVAPTIAQAAAGILREPLGPTGKPIEQLGGEWRVVTAGPRLQIVFELPLLHTNSGTVQAFLPALRNRLAALPMPARPSVADAVYTSLGWPNVSAGSGFSGPVRATLTTETRIPGQLPEVAHEQLQFDRPSSAGADNPPAQQSVDDPENPVTASTTLATCGGQRYQVVSWSQTEWGNVVSALALARKWHDIASGTVTGARPVTEVFLDTAGVHLALGVSGPITELAVIAGRPDSFVGLATRALTDPQPGAWTETRDRVAAALRADTADPDRDLVSLAIRNHVGLPDLTDTPIASLSFKSPEHTRQVTALPRLDMFERIQFSWGCGGVGVWRQADPGPSRLAACVLIPGPAALLDRLRTHLQGGPLGRWPGLIITRDTTHLVIAGSGVAGPDWLGILHEQLIAGVSADSATGPDSFQRWRVDVAQNRRLFASLVGNEPTVEMLATLDRTLHPPRQQATLLRSTSPEEFARLIAPAGADRELLSGIWARIIVHPVRMATLLAQATEAGMQVPPLDEVRAWLAPQRR